MRPQIAGLFDLFLKNIPTNHRDSWRPVYVDPAQPLGAGLKLCVLENGKTAVESKQVPTVETTSTARSRKLPGR